MSEPDYDAVIAGGGLAGLTLAAHLAAGGWRDRRVLVVDDRAARPTAVSWGFWSDRAGLLDAAVSRTYERVASRRPARPDAAARPVPVPGRAAARPRPGRALDAGRCQGFEFRAGHVEGVHDGTEAAETVVDGHVVRSTWAFDSASRSPTGAPVDARLAFTGWEVVCDPPGFDPDRAHAVRLPHRPGRGRPVRVCSARPTHAGRWSS